MRAVIAISAVCVLFGTGYLFGNSMAYASLASDQCLAQSQDVGRLWGLVLSGDGHELVRVGDVWCLK